MCVCVCVCVTKHWVLLKETRVTVHSCVCIICLLLFLLFNFFVFRGLFRSKFAIVNVLDVWLYIGGY